MDFAGLNYWAVLAAAIVSFLFGSIWYGLLGKQWVYAVGKTEDEIKTAAGSVPLLMISAFIAQLVMAFVFAGVLGHLGTDQVTLKNGVISAAFLWAGFVLTTIFVNHSFQGQSRRLTAIDSGHWLGVLLLQGAVLGMLGVG